MKIAFMSKFVLLAFTLAIAGMANANAQTPAAAPVASGKTYVLIPYDQPDGKDEHASAVRSDLSKDLDAAHITVTTAAPMDHLEAVEHAASLCAQYHADGLLVPEGRDEQTVKMVYAVLMNVTKYPTHVEFRLDEIGCDGVVHWSKTTTADRTTSGFTSSNLDAVVDDAFNGAIADATSAFAQATIADYPPAKPAADPPASAAHLDPAAKYLVVPFAQPGLADPHADDIMHSFMGKLETRKITATAAAPMDRLTVIATAQSLCSAAGASAIIVPSLRIEQSSFHGDSYAELRLDVVGCNGVVLAKSLGTANYKRGTLRNFGADAVEVSEMAMDPALTQLFPS